LCPVARIDLNEAVKAGVRVWLPSVRCVAGLFGDNQLFVRLASKSDEVLCEGVVPSAAFEIYRPKIEVRQLAQFGATPPPQDLGALVPVKVLGGTTQATEMKDAGTKLHWVIKRGLGGKLSGTSRLFASRGH
jgi:hypothetical protein